MKARILAGLIAGLLLACFGDGPIDPPADEGGELDLVAVVANSGDAAFRITLRAPVTSYRPAAGFDGFIDVGSSETTIVAVSPSPLPPGETLLGVVVVPAMNAARNGTVTIEEVATGGFSVRNSMAGYSVRLR